MNFQAQDKNASFCDYKTTPSPNKVNSVLIRLAEAYVTETIDASEYKQGPERFALATMSDLVKKFFTDTEILGHTYDQQYPRRNRSKRHYRFNKD